MNYKIVHELLSLIAQMVETSTTNYNRHFVSAIGTEIFRFGCSKARYALSFLGEHCPIFLAD